ncbi:MAG: transcription antitermination factor NusB [Bacteroidales bacterium]|jgi:N utilization substance protein B|nr:transcription antitermination factor NusB [Bacteroidales bacterium]
MISRRLLRIKILQVLYAHFNSVEPGLVKSEKELGFSIKKAYDLYYYLFLLIISTKRYAESRIELARNKRLPTFEDLHPNTRFIDNEVIRQIEESPAFNAYLSEQKLSWVNYPELIKNLYNRLVESPYYLNYMEADTCNYEDDKNLLIEFYSNEIEEHEMFFKIMEEQSIFWNDDIEFVVSMVVKTIKGMKEDKSIKLLPIYKSEDDKEFAFKLLRTSIRNYAEYEKRIEDSVDNWDIERIAMIDNLIMQMAINELIEFPSIPIKVTFDEYLELAKYYSTPKSSIFINGLLDKISSDLTKEGKIVKIGRGLITES